MNKLLYFIALLISVLFIDTFHAQEQELPVLIPNSPEATEFLKHGNTSVSMYTGSPNIGIPIYTIQGKEFSLPISLNYDAGGIKVNQIATQVGLAWSLQAGGVISRITNGKPDHVIGGATEYYGSYYTHYDKLSAFYQTTPLENQIYQPVNPSYFSTLAEYFLFEQEDILSGELDTQPDYFSFNVGNISGSIYIDPVSGEARCNNGKNYKVSYTGSLSNFTGGGIIKWHIIDELGNQYFFDKYDTTRTLIDSSGEDNSKTFISSWQLTKIISANGIDILIFNHSFSSFWQNEKYVPAAVSNVSNLTFSTNNSMNPCPQVTGGFNSNTTPYQIEQHYLSSISLNGNIIITFQQSAGERKDLSNRYALEKISIFDGIDWELHQSYFKSSPNIDLNNITDITQDDIRLKLDSIIKKTNGSTVGQQTYSFDYFNPNDIPNLQSFSQDYWGFYNGKSNTSSLGLVPKMTVLDGSGNILSFTGADRDPDFNYGKNGTLSKINYPTGGHTDFEYEPHNIHKTETDTEIVFNNIPMGSLGGGNDITDPYDYWDDEYFFDDPKGAEFIVPVYESGVKDIAIQYFSPNLPYGLGDNDDGILFVAILKCSGAAPTPPDDCGDPGGLTISGCPLNLDWEDIINYPVNDRILIRSYKGGGDPGSLPNGYTEIIPIDLDPGFYKVYILNGVTNSSLSVSMRYNTIETENQITAKTIGGLRIKKTKDYTSDNGSPILTKSYTYTKTAYDDCGAPYSASTGVLHFNPIYSDYKSVSMTTYEVGQTLTANSCSYLNRYSQPLNPQKSPHVAYTTVTEKYLDNNGADIGASEFHFYNDVDQTSSAEPSIPFLKANFKNGNIAYQLYFDKSNVLKQKTVNTYGQTQVTNSIQAFKTVLDDYTEDAILKVFNILGQGQKFEMDYPGVCGNFQGYIKCYTDGFPFPIQSYGEPFTKKLHYYYTVTNNYAHLDETITTNYFGTDSLTTKTNYYYDGLTQFPKTHRQVSRTKTLTTDGKTILTQNYYPDDINSTSDLGLDLLTASEKAAIDNLKNRNSKAIPIQSSSYQDINANDVGDANELLSTQRTNYKELGLNMILPEFVQTLKGAYNSTSNVLEDRVVYHQYDGNGNPLEISKKDGTRVCYVWGYNQRYPVAKIENSTYSQIASLLLNNGLDIQNRSNLDDDRTLDYNGNEGALRSKLDDFRNLPELSSAVITTYTYDPLIGVPSITNPKGYTIYYEYDDFNRLKQVKDATGNILSSNEYHYKNQ